MGDDVAHVRNTPKRATNKDTAENVNKQDLNESEQKSLVVDTNDVTQELFGGSESPKNFTQATLISYLVFTPDAWTLASSIVKKEFFDKEFHEVIDLLFEHATKYDKLPSAAVIKMKTGVSLFQPDDAEDVRTLAWLLDEIEQFCKHQAMRIEVLKAADLLAKDRSRATHETIHASVKAVVEMAIHRDVGIEVHKDAQRILELPEDQIVVPTGFRHIDLLLGGGVARPSMTLFAGKSGFGKTVTLCNMGAKFASRGYNVLYLSLELTAQRILPRIVSMMTGIPIREVRRRSDEVGTMMAEKFHAGDGYLRVKKMPMAGTTVGDIEAVYRKTWMVEEAKPDVLICDYIDLLYPRTKGIRLDNIHLKDKYSAEELYDFISNERNNLICFTASQLKKGSEEQENPGQDTVAGGQPKISVLDNLGLLRRDFENDMMFIKWDKARDGGHNGTTPLRWNNETLLISDAEDEHFYANNPRFNPDLQRRGSNSKGSKSVNTNDVHGELAAQRAMATVLPASVQRMFLGEDDDD